MTCRYRARPSAARCSPATYARTAACSARSAPSGARYCKDRRATTATSSVPAAENHVPDACASETPPCCSSRFRAEPAATSLLRAPGQLQHGSEIVRVYPWEMCGSGPVIGVDADVIVREIARPDGSVGLTAA